MGAVQSDDAQNEKGFPQGSALGPLLISLFLLQLDVMSNFQPMTLCFHCITVTPQSATESLQVCFTNYAIALKNF